MTESTSDMAGELRILGEGEDWREEAGPRGQGQAGFGERLQASIRERGADAFSMAYELTKIYANSGGGKAEQIPAMFADLFEMFELGVDPRGSSRGDDEDKKHKDKKKKDK